MWEDLLSASYRRPYQLNNNPLKRRMWENLLLRRIVGRPSHQKRKGQIFSVAPCITPPLFSPSAFRHPPFAASVRPLPPLACPRFSFSPSPRVSRGLDQLLGNAPSYPGFLASRIPPAPPRALLHGFLVTLAPSAAGPPRSKLSPPKPRRLPFLWRGVGIRWILHSSVRNPSLLAWLDCSLCSVDSVV